MIYCRSATHEFTAAISFHLWLRYTLVYGCSKPKCIAAVSFIGSTYRSRGIVKNAPNETLM